MNEAEGIYKGSYIKARKEGPGASWGLGRRGEKGLGVSDRRRRPRRNKDHLVLLLLLCLSYMSFFFGQFTHSIPQRTLTPRHKLHIC